MTVQVKKVYSNLLPRTTEGHRRPYGLQALNLSLGALGTIRHKSFHFTADGRPPYKLPGKGLACVDAFMAVVKKLQHVTLKQGWGYDADTLQKQPLTNTDVFLMLPIVLDAERQAGLFGPPLGAIRKEEVALAVTGLVLAEFVES